MRLYVQLQYGLLGAGFPFGLNYSTGLDTIAASLRKLGDVETDLVCAGILRYELTSRNTARVQSAINAKRTPILVGHSLGADEITYITQSLPRAYFPVIACIDPTNWSKIWGTGPVPVTPNVKIAFDFFQRNVSPGGGQLSLVDRTKTQLFSIERPSDTHVTIDDDPVVLNKIVDAVRPFAVA